MDIFSVCDDVISHPERLIITHWFNPPHLMKLIEVVCGPKTSEETAAAVRGLSLIHISMGWCPTRDGCGRAGGTSCTWQRKSSCGTPPPPVWTLRTPRLPPDLRCQLLNPSLPRGQQNNTISSDRQHTDCRSLFCAARHPVQMKGSWKEAFLRARQSIFPGENADAP